MEILAEAGIKLRDMRKKLNLSIYKVAKEIHITGNYLSLIERGKRSPSDEVLLNIASFYKIDKEEVFGMYNRVVPQSRYDDLNRELRQIITQISVDKRLTMEERESCIEQILLTAKEIARGNL